MHGFFIHGFPKLIRFQAHHDKVLKKFEKNLKRHMDKQGIESGIYTIKWFFQCFLDRVSKDSDSNRVRIRIEFESSSNRVISLIFLPFCA